MTQSNTVRAVREMGLDPEQLRADPAFTHWLKAHRRLELDDQTLYLRRGDHLAGVDQMMLDWAIETHGNADRAEEAPQDDQDQDQDFLDIEGGPE